MGSLTLKAFQTPLLAAFNLELAAGECITLTGPSGYGKSLLLRAIADLDAQHQGEAFVDQTSRQSLTGSEWRRRIGLLPAESAWWGELISDHLPRQDPSLLQSLGLPPESESWSVSRLSSGEKQRFGLTRLLLNHPKVLLLDEPTANLDQTNRERVETLIESWRKTQNSAVIWVTHDPAQQQRVAHRHLQIVQGNLQETTWN
ncbi:MAG: ATP-binding protein [endosymbiont of Seepiophila jonesi]|uniref:ATP-binding protein n=1 Tax=endosymbiont of Lamellibrachia luymesi TaxID=2200907 RepID=A0A370DZM0_9GAMM|nr:MAG: ATP-binding protein [endosymbiont of Seepiophila jonesi]RDH92143.1 MAG: ATP-binding protein [endosymbiont of Lamellibrachia luymesi]